MSCVHMELFTSCFRVEAALSCANTRMVCPNGI